MAEVTCWTRGVLVMPDIFMNAGGVTVSYFEWTRNISHMRYGRLDRRLDHARRTNLVDAVEELVDRRFDHKKREKLTEGTDEEDLVNSGLEETMAHRVPGDRRYPQPVQEGDGSAHTRPTCARSKRSRPPISNLASSPDVTARVAHLD